MAQPTATELSLLEKFRENLRDVVLEEEEQSDMALVAWIRARENNLVKAEDMLRKSLEWRRKVDFVNLFNWIPPPNYLTAFRYRICGSDDEGRPVVLLPFGRWDIRKVVDAGERETYLRYVDLMFERLSKIIRQSTNELGTHHTQFVSIFDLEGMSLRQFTRSTVETVLETFRTFEANYPETLKNTIAVNAPRIFPILFELAKPLLSQRTRNKIFIFNCNEAKWKPVLLGMMPEKTFQQAFNEPIFTSPEKGSKEEKENDEHLIETSVEAGGKFEISFDVRKAGSILRWEFETKNYDIGFSVVCESTEVYLYERMNSYLNRIEGFHLCQNLGKYTLCFDNSYSRRRSKSVRYFIKLEEDNYDVETRNGGT